MHLFTIIRGMGVFRNACTCLSFYLESFSVPPHLLRACHSCIMAYEGSQPSISRPCGFGLIFSTYQVLSKEAFASATPFTTIKGVDKSKKKKLPDSTLTSYVTLWSYLAFYVFRFFYLRWRICINDPWTLSVLNYEFPSSHFDRKIMKLNIFSLWLITVTWP